METKYEASPNSISVFKNNSTKENAPMIRGSLRISLEDIVNMPSVDHYNKEGKKTVCVDLDVSLWSKVAKDGTPYWAGSVKKKWVPESQSANIDFPHGAVDHSQYSDGSDIPQDNSYSQPTQSPQMDNDLPF